jgi:hypothetical protein
VTLCTGIALFGLCLPYPGVSSNALERMGWVVKVIDLKAARWTADLTLRSGSFSISAAVTGRAKASTSIYFEDASADHGILPLEVALRDGCTPLSNSPDRCFAANGSTPVEPCGAGFILFAESATVEEVGRERRSKCGSGTAPTPPVKIGSKKKGYPVASWCAGIAHGALCLPFPGIARSELERIGLSIQSDQESGNNWYLNRVFRSAESVVLISLKGDDDTLTSIYLRESAIKPTEGVIERSVGVFCQQPSAVSSQCKTPIGNAVVERCGKGVILFSSSTSLQSRQEQRHWLCDVFEQLPVQ